MGKPKNETVVLETLLSDNSFYEKESSKTKSSMKFIGTLAAACIAVSALVAPIGFATAAGVNVGVGMWESMDEDLLKDEIRLPQVTTLLDRDGKKFASFYSENRQNVDLEKVSPNFVNALVATEDSRFYQNNGFDVVGLARSFVSTTSGAEKQGASGLTQQLVKNILILNAANDEERSAVQNRVIKTKVQEIKYAISLEEKYSKEEILEMYVNTVYFGNRAYGIKAAAKTYFNTTPDKLTLQQSATLVGVINNPTVYDPLTKPENSDKRKNTVLWRMLQEKHIDQKTYDKEIKTKVKTTQGNFENGCGKSEFAYYCELVRQEILNNPAFGSDREARETFLYQGGLTITTAMDPKVMKTVEKEVTRAWGNKNRVASGVAVIKPGTGQIVGIGQNRKWGNGDGKTELIFATRERQTGSAFKPFTLVTAYEQGIDAGSTVLNSDSFYKPSGWQYPKPRGFSNFGYYNYGNVTGAAATRQSLNVWFVRMMQKTGVVPVAEMANRLGLSVPTDPNVKENESTVTPTTLSLALGAWGASPIEMANAYSVFSSGGIKCNTVSILSAKMTDTGEKVKVSDPDCHQALMPNVANQMNKIMQEPFKDGGTLPDYRLNNGQQAAGKTGTSNNKGDAWVVGYTPKYSTAIWSGDPRGASHTLSSYNQYGYYRAGSLAGTGGPTSGPIWEKIMNDLHKGTKKENFASPSSAVSSAIKGTAIPEVIGLDVNSAVTSLQDYGYVVKISDKTIGDPLVIPKNTVMAQNPNGGNNGVHGQEVTLTLSAGSDIDIIVQTKTEAQKKGEK